MVHVEENDSGLAKFISIVNYEFTAGDEDSELVCAADAGCIDGYGRVSNSASEVVDVHCECNQLLWLI